MTKYLSYYDDSTGTKFLYCHIPKVIVEWTNKKYTNKKAKENSLKTYALIHFKYDRNLTKRKKKGKNTPNLFVELSYRYFEQAVCSRPSKYLASLKESGFIEAFKTFHPDPSNVFNDIPRESYHPGKRAKKYRPLILPTSEDPIFRFDQSGIVEAHKSNPVYQKNLSFLKAHNLPEKVFRDTYMTRYYTSCSTNYKELFFKGITASQYVLYDIKSSVPMFIKEILENQERPVDQELLDLYKGDFYMNFGKHLWRNGIIKKPISRNRSKQLFVNIIFGKSYQRPQNIARYLERVMPNFMIEVNHGLGYRAVRREVKYLEQILTNIKGPALTIHDSIILAIENESQSLKVLHSSMFQKKKIIN